MTHRLEGKVNGKMGWSCSGECLEYIGEFNFRLPYEQKVDESGFVIWEFAGGLLKYRVEPLENGELNLIPYKK